MEKERHLPNPSICWVQKPFVEKGDFKPYITSFLLLKDSGDGSSKWRCQNPRVFGLFAENFMSQRRLFCEGIYTPPKTNSEGIPLQNGWLEDFLLSFWDSACFQMLLLLVSGSVSSNFSWKFIANILRESIAYESPLPVNSTLVSSFLVVRITSWGAAKNSCCQCKLSQNGLQKAIERS